MITIETIGFKEVIAYIDDIAEKLKPEKILELNEKRANTFRQYTINAVSSGSLGLEELSDFSIALRGEHAPLYDTGSVLKAMGIYQDKNGSVSAGYRRKGEAARKYRREKETPTLTIYQIVQLQHVKGGFRIPKNKDITAAMRYYFLYRGVKVSESKKFFTFKPRPFLYVSLKKYMVEGHDNKIISAYMRNLYKK